MSRTRLSYANVVSTLALFLAVAGGTTAVALSGKNNVDKNDIQKGAVDGREVKSNSLFARDLGKGSVDTSELRGASVTGGKIVDGSVWSRELGTGAVAGEDIKAGAVTGGAVADGSIAGADLLDGSVTGADVLNGSLTGADVLNRSIGEPDLAAVPAVRVTGGPQSAPSSSFESASFTADSGVGSGRYDPLDMWDPADPEVIVVPVDGMYIAAGKVGWANDDTETPGGMLDQGWRLLQIAGPGNQDIRTTIGANRFGSEIMRHSHTVILNLEAGDEVSMQFAQSNEDATAVSATEFELAVSWIGPSPGPVD